MTLLIVSTLFTDASAASVIYSDFHLTNDHQDCFREEAIVAGLVNFPRTWVPALTERLDHLEASAYFAQMGNAAIALQWKPRGPATMTVASRQNVNRKLADIQLKLIKGKTIIKVFDFLKENTNADGERKIVDYFMSHRPRYYYSYSTLVRDLFGAAFKSKQGAATVFRPLSHEPIAIFHETGEYLLAKGLLDLRLEGEFLIVSLEGKEDIKIQLSREAQLLLQLHGKKDPHYLLIALQRTIFPILNAHLSAKIYGYGLISRLESVVNKEDLASITSDQEFKTYFKNHQDQYEKHNRNVLASWGKLSRHSRLPPISEGVFFHICLSAGWIQNLRSGSLTPAEELGDAEEPEESIAYVSGSADEQTSSELIPGEELSKQEPPDPLSTRMTSIDAKTITKFLRGNIFTLLDRYQSHLTFLSHSDLPVKIRTTLTSYIRDIQNVIQLMRDPQFGDSPSDTSNQKLLKVLGSLISTLQMTQRTLRTLASNDERTAARLGFSLDAQAAEELNQAYTDLIRAWDFTQTYDKWILSGHFSGQGKVIEVDDAITSNLLILRTGDLQLPVLPSASPLFVRMDINILGILLECAILYLSSAGRGEIDFHANQEDNYVALVATHRALRQPDNPVVKMLMEQIVQDTGGKIQESGDVPGEIKLTIRLTAVDPHDPDRQSAQESDSSADLIPHPHLMIRWLQNATQRLMGKEWTDRNIERVEEAFRIVLQVGLTWILHAYVPHGSLAASVTSWLLSAGMALTAQSLAFAFVHFGEDWKNGFWNRTIGGVLLTAMWAGYPVKLLIDFVAWVIKARQRLRNNGRFWDGFGELFSSRAVGLHQLNNHWIDIGGYREKINNLPERDQTLLSHLTLIEDYWFGQYRWGAAAPYPETIRLILPEGSIVQLKQKLQPSPYYLYEGRIRGYRISFNFYMRSDRLVWRQVKVDPRAPLHIATSIGKWLLVQAIQRFPNNPYPLEIESIQNPQILRIAHRLFLPESIEIRYSRRDSWKLLDRTDLYQQYGPLQIGKSQTKITRSYNSHLIQISKSGNAYRVIQKPEEVDVTLDGPFIRVEDKKTKMLLERVMLSETFDLRGLPARVSGPNQPVTKIDSSNLWQNPTAEGLADFVLNHYRDPAISIEEVKQALWQLREATLQITNEHAEVAYKTLEIVRDATVSRSQELSRMASEYLLKIDKIRPELSRRSA